MGKLNTPYKLVTVELPIETDVLKVLQDVVKLRTPGLPENTPEGVIGDAIFFYFAQPINDFLRAYIENRTMHYPKPGEKPSFVLGVVNDK